VNGVIADSAGGAWSFGSSILTFAFPMILFIVVALALYILYTKPEVVPGHRIPSVERPVSYTAIPGTPAATEVPGTPAAAAGTPAPGPSAPSAPGAPGAPASPGTRAAAGGSPAAGDGARAGEGENADPEARA
jgi:hypothetical protein